METAPFLRLIKEELWAEDISQFVFPSKCYSLFGVLDIFIFL